MKVFKWNITGEDKNGQRIFNIESSEDINIEEYQEDLENIKTVQGYIKDINRVNLKLLDKSFKSCYQ